MLLQLSNGAFTFIGVNMNTSMPFGSVFILGMDGIKALGGVTVDTRSSVHFGVQELAIFAAADTVVGVEESDFSVTYYDPVVSCRIGWRHTTRQKICTKRSC